MAQKMYADAQPGAAGGADPGAGAGAKDNDAVDAEFEEVKEDK